MTEAAKLEARLLTAAELALVGITRPPEIERQSVDELKAAARRLREAHDRAKGIGTRQAREMRGKADPRGAKPAKDNSGTVGKAQALRDALDRVEAELKRRDAALLSVEPISRTGFDRGRVKTLISDRIGQLCEGWLWGDLLRAKTGGSHFCCRSCWTIT